MAETTALSAEHKKAFREILGNTPVVAVGMGKSRPETIEDVIAAAGKMSEYLKYVMGREQDALGKLNEIEDEIEQTGKLLRRLGLGSDSSKELRDAFKAVLAAVQIRHEFTATDVRQIAEKHGVQL